MEHCNAESEKDVLVSGHDENVCVSGGDDIDMPADNNVTGREQDQNISFHSLMWVCIASLIAQFAEMKLQAKEGEPESPTESYVKMPANSSTPRPMTQSLRPVFQHSALKATRDYPEVVLQIDDKGKEDNPNQPKRAEIGWPIWCKYNQHSAKSTKAGPAKQ
ncbi:TIR-NBS-LRR RCT1 resistance protein, partial [Trifolium medium]|nr:TIR-NBS-LRR RCT1 resistance protein [Trifolium medium]